MNKKDIEKIKNLTNSVINICIKIPFLIIGLILFIEGIISLFIDKNKYSYLFTIVGLILIIISVFISKKLSKRNIDSKNLKW